MNEPIKVFISYSHQDDSLKKELCEHLWSLQHRELIQPWNDRDIDAAMDWEHEINENLAQADIVLMLVSSSFISSNYCYCIEMKRALQRHQEGTAKVIPVIIRACVWTKSPLGSLQGFPLDNKAVATWGDKFARDPAWVQITEAIGKVAQQIKDRRIAEHLATQKEQAKAEFRSLAAEYYQSGGLSPTKQALLETARQRLGLTELEATEIEEAIKLAQQQRSVNLAKYQATLVAELGGQEELSAEQREDLKQLQFDLGFSENDRDIAQIEQKVLAERAIQQRQPPQHQQNSELTGDITLATCSLEVLQFDQSGQEQNRTYGLAQYFIESLSSEIDLEMAYIPAGTFQMGSPGGQQYKREQPQHEVTVPAFLMGKYPVTQAQWRFVVALPSEKIALNAEPSYFPKDRHPVETVSWHEAEEFCRRLSRYTKRSYRLPSEAEWEYACRAGTTTDFYFGDTLTPRLANCNNSVNKTTVVGSYLPNAFGLYDMHGNVWEWCADHWHNNYQRAPADGSAWIDKNDNGSRLLRGGSWFINPTNCRAADRDCNSAGLCYYNVGFRLVCAVFPALL